MVGFGLVFMTKLYYGLLVLILRTKHSQDF